MLKTGPDVTGLSRTEAREARLRFWRDQVVQARKALASGQTQTDYCRDQGISAGAYFWWKKILNRMDRGTNQVATSSRRPRRKAPAFIPLEVREAPAGPGAPYLLEIGLGADRVVRVREGCDPKLLEAVVRLVGELPC